MTRQNMSTVVNKGVNICYKAVMTKLLTVVGLIVELRTEI